MLHLPAEIMNWPSRLPALLEELHAGREIFNKGLIASFVKFSSIGELTGIRILRMALCIPHKDFCINIFMAEHQA